LQNATDCATFTPQNTYTYSYDGLNRLIAAASNLGAGTLKAGVGDESYQYDKIGNITSLTRKVIAGNSLETVQQAYSYATGNDSLLGAAFTTTSPRAPFGQTASHTYTYDPNGNLQTDTRRSITQTDYQRANLPNHLVKDGNDIFYEYDINDNRMYKYASASISPLLAGSEYYVRSAAGQDLAIWKLDEQKTTYYIFGSSRLASIETNEDGTFPTATTFYNYDHLGNTRLSYNATPSCSGAPLYTATAAFDYYPYGKVLREFGASVYMTTAHERDAESGLDYRGARFYDSEVARFLSLDPLAVKYASLSAYAYVAGNPVIIVDSDGKDNIVYVVMTDAGKAAMKKNNLDATQVINFMNTTFQDLGVEVRYQLVSGADDVSLLQHMDKTDAVTVWGTTRDDINNYTKTNINNVVDKISMLDDTEQFSSTYPELSEVAGNWSEVSVNQSIAYGKNMGFTKQESLALVTMHGTAHNAGNSADHNRGRGNGLEEDGQLVLNRINHTFLNTSADYKNRKDIFKAENNTGTVFDFNKSNKHFNTKPAKDNRAQNNLSKIYFDEILNPFKKYNPFNRVILDAGPAGSAPKTGF
jgi:RHS repeat-associated protein